MANIRWLKLDPCDQEMIDLIVENKIGELRREPKATYIGIRLDQKKRKSNRKIPIIRFLKLGKENESNFRQYCAIIKKN